MHANRVTLVVLLAAVIVGLAIAPATSAVGTGGYQADDGDRTTEDADRGMGLGAGVSAFMQSSAADANESVETGMFAADFDRANAERREAVVIRQLARLEDRVETLEAERNRLQATIEEYEAEGEEPPSRLQAKMTRLTVRLGTFEESLNETESRATVADVEMDQFEELRTNARNLFGQAAATLAAGAAGVNSPGGPPVDLPGFGNGPFDVGDGNEPVDAGDEPPGQPGPPGDTPSGLEPPQVLDALQDHDDETAD